MVTEDRGLVLDILGFRCNQGFKRRRPAGSWRSGKREFGTVIFIGKMSGCYRRRSPEVRQEIREEVVALSSGPVQHLQDG